MEKKNIRLVKKPEPVVFPKSTVYSWRCNAQDNRHSWKDQDGQCDACGKTWYKTKEEAYEAGLQHSYKCWLSQEYSRSFEVLAKKRKNAKTVYPVQSYHPDTKRSGGYR